MTWTLIKQDPAWRGLRIVLPIFLGCGLLTRLINSDISTWLAARETDPEARIEFAIFFCMMWLTLAFFMFTGGFWSRSSRLHMTLPLSPRRLWLSRQVPIIAIWLLPLIIWFLPVAIHDDALAGGPLFAVVFIEPVCRLGASLLLLNVLAQLPTVELNRIRFGARYVIYLITLLLGIYLGTLFTTFNWWAVGLSVGIAFGCGTFIYFRLPPTFRIGIAPSGGDGGMSPHASEMSSSDGRRADVVEGKIESRSAWSDGCLLQWTVGRQLYNHGIVWFLLPIIALYSGQWIVAFLTGSNTIYFALFLALYSWVFIAICTNRAHRLAHLPIARRVLAGWSILPFLVLIIFSASCIALYNVNSELPSGQISFADDEIKVPVESWEVALDGAVPQIESPWGETYRPIPKPLWRGLTVRLYNPFGWDENSSGAFRELQVARAFEAVHDDPVDMERIGAIRAGDGAVAARVASEPRYTFAESRGRISPLRIRAQAAGLIVLILLSGLMQMAQLKGLGTARLRKLYLAVSPAILILGFACFLLVLVGQKLGLTSLDAVSAFILVPLRKVAETLPLGLPGLISLVGLVFAATFWLVQRGFRQIQFLGAKRKQFLVEYDS